MPHEYTQYVRMRVNMCNSVHCERVFCKSCFGICFAMCFAMYFAICFELHLAIRFLPAQNINAAFAYSLGREKRPFVNSFSQSAPSQFAAFTAVRGYAPRDMFAHFAHFANLFILIPPFSSALAKQPGGSSAIFF